ncbi:MAG: hypothetical protein IT181_25365 [Acidobacteria bacterium]|nr:hypothetical protein [Acidobacteriota bacterium]
MIACARPLSPTLDGQLQRLASLPIIVYVEDLDDRAAPYDGRLSFIGAGHGHRFLRIQLRRLPVATAAAVLAHELQHVLEVAASPVTSRPEFDALYRTIGMETGRSGATLYDTVAAVASGNAAMRELAIYALTTRGQ